MKISVIVTDRSDLILHSQIDQAIQNLQQAINLNPEEWREMAKTDSDFDSVRSHPQFQALIQG